MVFSPESKCLIQFNTPFLGDKSVLVLFTGGVIDVQSSIWVAAMGAFSTIIVILACASSFMSSNGSRFTVPIYKAETSVGHEKLRNTLRLAASGARTQRKNFTAIEPLNTNDISSLFYGTVQFGDPPQSLKVNIDTGSADLWVVSGRSSYCKSMSCYNSLLSSTYVENGTEFTEEYAKGSSSGFLSWDKVEISGAVIPRQLFGEAMYIDDHFFGQPYDGIWGMAFPDSSSYMTPPFFSLIKEKAFDVNAFSFKLSKHGQDGSSLELGGWDPSIVKSDSDIKWIPITVKILWQFAIDNISIGNVSLHGQQGVADTGATLISVPKRYLVDIAAALKAEINEQGFLLVQTSQVASLPNFTLTTANASYTLTPDDYVVMTDGDYSLLGFDAFMEADLWLIGDVFLSKFYTIFNVDKASIAFCDLPETTPTPTAQTQTTPTTVTKAVPTLPTPTTHHGGGASAAKASSLLLSLILSFFIFT